MTAVAGARTPTRGLVRLLRIGLLGSSSLTLAAGAHLAGGGTLPGFGVLLAAGLLLGLGAVALTGYRCRFGVLVVVLTGQQGLLHWLFGAAGGVGTGCEAMAAALAHHTMPGGSCHGASAMAHMTGGLGRPGGVMLVAHLLAVVATAWVLTRGEAWFWRTAGEIATAAVAAPSRRRPRRPRTVVAAPTPVVVAAVALSVAAPRGPPQCSR